MTTLIKNLRDFMSKYPDFLVANAKYYGHFKEDIIRAELKSINTTSMTITCYVKGGTKKDVVVMFDPMLGVIMEKNKARLIEMSAIAQENLGMVPTSRVESFKPPIVQLFLSALTIAFCYFAAYPPTDSSSALLGPALWARERFGARFFELATKFFIVAHPLEALYTLYLSLSQATPVVGLLYTISALLFGMPVWTDLQEKAKQARIENAKKRL